MNQTPPSANPQTPTAPTQEGASPSATGATPEAPKKPLTFDSIDEIVFSNDVPPSKREGAPKEEASDDDDDFDDDDDDDDALEAESGDDEEESEEDETDEEEAEDEADDNEEGAEKKEKGEELEGDDSKIVKVKVDGKVRELTLGQMKNLVASGLHTKERYEKFTQEQRDFEQTKAQQIAELSVINAKITPIHEALKANDAKTAMIELAKLNGKSRLEIERRLRQQLFPVFVDMLGLDPAAVREHISKRQSEIRQFEVEEENRFLKEEREYSEKQAEKTRKPKELEETERQIVQLQAQHGVSQTELRDAFQFAAQNIYSGDQDKVTIDDLQRVVLGRRLVTRAVDAIALKRPRLASDQKFVDATVKKLQDNPTWSAERIGRWIEKRARKLSVKSDATALTKDISRKVLKSGLKPRLENPSERKTKPMKFSDFDEDGGGLI